LLLIFVRIEALGSRAVIPAGADHHFESWVVIVVGNDFEQFQSVENAYTVFWGLRLFCEPTLTIPDLAANFEISNL
jgi:hypothetical protein